MCVVVVLKICALNTVLFDRAKMKPYLKSRSGPGTTPPAAASRQPGPTMPPVQQDCAHTRQGMLIASQHKSPREKLCLSDIVSILQRGGEK